MARQPTSVDNDGGSVQDNVRDTFAEEFLNDDMDDTSAEGADDSNVEGEGPDETGDEDFNLKSEDDNLPDFEKFLRDSDVKPNGKQALKKEEEQRKKPDRYEQDQKGNVVDPKTGKVLARAGAEARLYMDTRRAKMEAYQLGRERDEMRGHLQEAVRFIEGYKSQLTGMREAMGAATKLGVTPQEQAQGVEFIARLKKGGTEGLQAIKEILTRAAAAGMDVASLGVGGLDVKTVVDQIRQELQPIRDDFGQRRQTEERQRQVSEEQQRAYDSAARQTIDFFQNNEDAIPYAKAIEAALRDPRYRGWSLREVWQQIQLYRARRGESSHRGLPRGGRVPMERTSGEQIAHPNVSYEDMVNEILDEHGLQ